MFFRKIFCVAPVAAMCLFALGGGAAAQEQDEPPSPGAVPAPVVSDSDEIGEAVPNFENFGALEAFVDGIVESYMKHDEIQGVMLSVVKDGEIVMLKGYGRAGIDPPREVDPSSTLFRVGSISKTFIWTSIMQLVEEGRLSLDDPVNDFLPDRLKVRDQGFSEPIRIWHLMTHTPGFEDTALGHLFQEDPDKILSLEDYLATYVPNRVRPPGDIITYSNYGAALAGYIVSRLSGVDFETYVEDHIYKPLGMSHSTFREPHGRGPDSGLPTPMSDELEKDVSPGFAKKSGAWQEQKYEFITSIGPAGAMSSTAADMARYMMAHLNGGALGDARILEPETENRMRQMLFANADGMNGFRHGFMYYTLPGRVMNFGHGGATIYFMSNMVMVPEYDLGVFVSTNTGSGRTLAVALPQMIVDRYFSHMAEAPKPPEDFKERGKKFVGKYMGTRHNYSGLEKLFAVLSIADVSLDDEGYLIYDDQRWVEIAPDLFRSVESDDIIGFREDADGTATELFPAFGTTAAERIGFFAGPQWLLLSAVLTIIAVIGSLSGAWLRRKRQIEQSDYEGYADRTMTILAALWVVFFIALGVALAGAAGLGNDLLFNFPTPSVVFTLTIVLLCTLGTLAAVASLVPVWRDGHWPIWRRIRHTLAALIYVAFVLTLNNWNLIGFKYY